MNKQKINEANVLKANKKDDAINGRCTSAIIVDFEQSQRNIWCTYLILLFITSTFL